MESHPQVGGDTAWVCINHLYHVYTTDRRILNVTQLSSYGLYDELSDSMKKIVENLHAVHTSRLMCKEINGYLLGPFEHIINTGHI